jgi:hypothetical protein
MNERLILARGPSNRVHVTAPELWNRAGGTDFWAVFGPESTVAAAGSSALLTDSGWTITSMVETAGTGADFIATADRTAPAHVLTDGGSDLVQSPAIFGDYMHAQVAAEILGYQPTLLIARFGFNFTVGTANETATNIGFIEAGGSPITAAGADTLAAFFSDGTNFKIHSGASASAAGPLVGAAWRVGQITLSNSVAAGTAMVTSSIDGVALPAIDLETDLFPVSFGMGIVAAGTNRIGLSYVHIWYA